MTFLRTTRNALALLAVVATVGAGAALAGCVAAQAGGQATLPNSGQAGVTWPVNLALPEPASLRIVSQVVDPGRKADFALTRGAHGSFVLRRTGLTDGQVKIGPSFPVSSIALAGSSVWVFGAQPVGRTSERVKLYRVNPRSLHTERALTEGPSRGGSGLAALAPGTHGTIWVSFGRTVLHLSGRTGSVIARLRVPAGQVAGDIALSPSGRLLYVATSPETAGGASSVFEYNAVSLRKLAVNAKTVTAVAVGGGALTAAPAGIWVSFRTGMLGRTVFLRQRDLRSVKLPGTGTRHSLFSWGMWASTLYSSPSLYLIQSDSAVAGCLNPRTGHIRARGTLGGHLEVDQLYAFGQDGRVLYAASQHGVVAIHPPAACRAA